MKRNTILILAALAGSPGLPIAATDSGHRPSDLRYANTRASEGIPLDTHRRTRRGPTREELVEQLTSPEGMRQLVALCRRLAVQRGGTQKAGGSGPVVGHASFDAASAPCFFSDTTAFDGVDGGLRFFATNGGTNGAGILDQCANFSVSPLSGGNFLALNTDPDASYLDGARPGFPLIIIGPPADFMGFGISGGTVVETLTLLGITELGLVQARTFDTQSASWDFQFVSTTGGAAFGALILVGDDAAFVVDDVLSLVAQ